MAAFGHGNAAVASIISTIRTTVLVMQEKQYPPYVSLYQGANCLRFSCLWWLPECGELTWGLTIIRTFICFVWISVMALTMLWHIIESNGDFIELGDDIVLFLGIVMVMTKMLNFRCSTKEIGFIISEFDRIHVRFAKMRSENREIRELQRSFFYHETVIIAVFMILLTFLAISIAVHPVFTGVTLPFRVKFPFGLHDPQRHPVGVIIIYIFQIISTFYCVYLAVMMDGIVTAMMSQAALNMRILCIRLRHLSSDDDGDKDKDKDDRNRVWNDLRDIVIDHQIIIGLIDRCNDVFWINYVAQLVTTNFIFCLAAIEIFMKRDQPMAAIKFYFYAAAILAQLSLYCWNGSMIYCDSLELVNAAYDVKDWFKESPQLQRNLMFIIMRAQKPLVFRAKYFNAFEFQTLTAILTSSYSYFAMLRTLFD